MENQPRFEKFTLNIILTSNINMISYHHTALYFDCYHMEVENHGHQNYS